jgi:uncharacterized protein YndB with AHSA1/START domain
MSVKQDQTGRRWVEVEVDVPGTPEDVWRAIATGPGITSWFVPTEFRDDRTVVSNFGPGMDSIATVVDWDPPHRYLAESRDLGPQAPPVATEWIVEARSGGTCTVRVVHSLFAGGDEWDDQLRSWESGWPEFFKLLRLYLTHFRGRSGVQIQAMGASQEPEADAWAAFTGALGLGGATPGQHVGGHDLAPPFEGIVEQAANDEHGRLLLLRLEQPAAGIGHFFALPMGGQVYLVTRLYLYGDAAPDAATRHRHAWETWIGERFPLGATANVNC